MLFGGTPAKKLLIVEDDPVVRRMYDRAFSMAGFDVYAAHDGTIVPETITLNQPDIVLMDVMMPNFNGLETLKDLKENPKTSHVPIIMLSAYDDEKIIAKAMELGAVRYLVKNQYDPQQIVDIINEILGIKDTADSQAQAA